MRQRIRSLLFFTALYAGLVLPAFATEIAVYKSPTCGCCKKWVEHMRANGFTVKAYDVEDVTPYKKASGVPLELGSCHTARVNGYALEGHVPARDIARLLKERPQVLGLAVPGMPAGAPGMEQGARTDRYDVLSFDAAGKTSVYARH